MMQIIHLRDTHKEIFYIYCFTQISYKRNFFKHRRQGIIITDDDTLFIYLFIHLYNIFHPCQLCFRTEKNELSIKTTPTFP
jgi:hypothetical protein